MPQFENLITKPFTAEGDITQWAAVCSGTADKQVKLPAATDAAAVGIAVHAAKNGERVEVAMPGSCVRAIAGGAIARDAWVGVVATTGRVAASALAVDDHILGQALTDATDAGDIVFIRVDPNPPVTVT